MDSGSKYPDYSCAEQEKHIGRATNPGQHEGYWCLNAVLIICKTKTYQGTPGNPPIEPPSIGHDVSSTNSGIWLLRKRTAGITFIHQFRYTTNDTGCAGLPLKKLQSGEGEMQNKSLAENREPA